MWLLVGTGEMKLRGSAYTLLPDADARDTLRQAEASGAYTIVPLVTFLAYHNPAKSAIIKEDTALILPYEIASPNAAQRPDYDPQPAQSFVAFLLGESAQAQIAAYGTNRAPFNRTLFYPALFAGFEPPH